MYLSRLDIFGFKSFAHRTRLEFNDGLTCVIGPNGSGKSNIVDAIRWVLGEQRVTSLRSDKMENVIFNGNKDRKPMGMAEVSMTIQNNRNILKMEFDEVVISRRLYRSGESQYLLNKIPVRLKDIIDLFMDTGMGANSYSVIELKMVETILSENKQERRQLFEEAAGVVKYKLRRKSALRKLEATQSDLTRINDIITEVDKNVSTLSRQVSKARRYLNYMEELKRSELDLACVRYHRLLDEIRPLTAQLEEISSKKEASYKQITIDEALIEDYKRELIQTEQTLRDVNSNLFNLDSNIARIKQEDAVSETKSEEISKAKDRYRLEISEFFEKIKVLEENISQYENEVETLENELEQTMQKFQEIEQTRISKNEILSREKTLIDQLNHEFRTQLQNVTQEKESLKQKKMHIIDRRNALNDLQARTETHKQMIASNTALLEKERQTQIVREKALASYHAEIARLEEELMQWQNDLERLETKQYDLVSELEKAKSRRNFYEQLIASYEGHSESTQYLMGSRDRFSGLHGPVSDLLSASEDIARLVEIILGNMVNFLVVEDVNAAMMIIDSIRNSNKGRVTCIPLERVNRIPVTKDTLPKDSFSFLTDYLHFDSKYTTLFHILLGDVVLVDSLNEALRFSEHYPGLRFVTRAGETIHFNRELSGGAFEKRSSVLVGRHDQLSKYKKQADAFTSELEQLKKQIDIVRGQIDTNKADQKAIRLNIDENQRSLLDTEKRLSQLQYEIDSHLLGKKEDERLHREILKDIAHLENVITESETKVAELGMKQDAFENELIEKTKAYDHKNEELQRILDEVQKIRLAVTNLQNQVSNRQNDAERAKKSIEEIRQSIHNREAEITQIEEELVSLKGAAEQRQTEQIGIWEKRDEIEDRKKEIDQKYQDVKSKIQHIEDQIRKYRREHDSTIERSRALELKINENRLKAEGHRERILKEYAEDIDITIPFEGLNETETEEKIDLLESRIRNLGPVNPLAVSEYDKEKERLDFLTQQRNDLNDAEKSLLETINKINKTAREQFLETFESIRINFEKVFRNFFENGEGTIKLEENQDPLEADIEVIVRTKGRRLQTLSLLSGGEKTLTAISLLFAIYLVKPSPFCILDEVDAPLDDINITRFTDALQSFAKNTQFIIVTHNKRTMESAQTMYGVTMEEEGVSKLVSVKFN